MANETNAQGLRPARRTIVKGAAWAVPAIAVAAPAHAATASNPVDIDWGSSSACKIPGVSQGGYCYDKGYVLWGSFTNTSAETVTVTVTSMTVGGVTQCIVGLTDPSISCDTPLAADTFTIDPGDEKIIAIYSNANTDSGSNTVTVGFNWSVPNQAPLPDSTSGTVTGGSWAGDSGQGSCTFPTGSNCTAPLSACDTPCATV